MIRSRSDRIASPGLRFCACRIRVIHIAWLKFMRATIGVVRRGYIMDPRVAH